MSGADPATTNNRMELAAVIEGLTALDRPSNVEVYSDSSYVLNGLEKWLDQWIRRGWKTASKKPVKNEDLWRQLDQLRKVHTLSYHWVRGHSDHPENERCDALAVAAREELVRQV
jgi:ribonuclease HI